MSRKILHGANSSYRAQLAVLFSALCIGMALAETSGNLNTSISWTLSNTGILRITGEGAIPDYSRVYTSSPFEENTDIKDVQIGSGITHIGSFLFYGCSNLLNLEIPQSVVSIGQYAFCKTLIGDLTLPLGVCSVDYKAFAECSNLHLLTVMNPSTIFDFDVFGDRGRSLSVYGWPGSTAETYADTYSHGFSEMAISGQCGDASWSMNPARGEMTVFGKGVIEMNIDWFDFKNGILSIVFLEGVEEIPEYVFNWLENLKSVTIPGSVHTIRDYTFSDTGLTEVILPYGVRTIGECAFFRCSDLKYVTIPESVTDIGETAFSQCWKLTAATIFSPDAVIPGDTFSMCSSGMSILGWTGSTAQAYASEHSISFRPLAEPSFILPASLTKIDADAFSGIRAEGVVIPKGVTEITGNPFSSSSVQLICGYAGSAAEKFASDYGFDFVAVNDAWIANR